MTLPPPQSAARPRLTTLVTAGVGATVLLTMLSLLMLVDYFAIDYVKREAGQRLQQVAWQMRDALDRVVQKAVGDVQLLSELPQVREAGSPAELRRLFESLQRTVPDYAWIGLTTPDGRVIAATQGLLEGTDVSARDWFKGGRTQLYAGDFHPASLPGQRLPAASEAWRFVDAAGPVRGADGALRGVLCVHMSWSWARRLVQSVVVPADRAYAAGIFVVRGDGTVMLGPKGTQDRPIGNGAGGQGSLTLARASTSASASGALRETWDDGQSYLSGYARTGAAGGPAGLAWSVIVRQPEQQALAAARALERRILLLGGLLGLAMTAAAAAMARRYTRPLNSLSADLERRALLPADAAGLPPLTEVDSFREIAVLSRALTRMVEQERGHLAALRAANEQLESTVLERTRDGARKTLQLERALAQEQSTQLLVQERAAELRAILDHAHDAFIALDPGGVVLDWNRQAEKLIGWRRSEVIGQPLGAMVLPPLLRRAYERDMRQLAELDEAGAALLNRRIELTLHNRDGRELPVEVSLAYVPRSSGHLFIAFLHDISERKRLFASLETMALRDTLTGLPNRRALLQTLGEALQRAQRLRQCCAVFFLDLDRFKQINDRHGHEEGDELLRQFAQRVQQAVRKTDTVGRLAGDEFIVIVEMLHSAADAHEAADKLQPLLRQPFVLKTATVTLGASVGVAVHQPDDPPDIEMLLGRADRAMYAHKQQRAQRQARR